MWLDSTSAPFCRFLQRMLSLTDDRRHCCITSGLVPLKTITHEQWRFSKFFFVDNKKSISPSIAFVFLGMRKSFFAVASVEKLSVLFAIALKISFEESYLAQNTTKIVLGLSRKNNLEVLTKCFGIRKRSTARNSQNSTCQY